jgi:hypothetical protein
LILPQLLTCKLSKPLAYITYPTLVQVVATWKLFVFSQMNVAPFQEGNCFHLKKCLVDFHLLHALINHIPKLQVQEVHILARMLMYAQWFNCLSTILFIFVPPLHLWFNLLQMELVMLKMICCLNWKCDSLLLMLKGLMLKGTEKKWLQDWK